MKKIKDLDLKSVNDIISISKKILQLTYFLIIIALIGGVIYIGRETLIFSVLLKIIDILMPLFIGFVIAWLFSPVVDSLQKKGVPRGIGTLIVYAVIILVAGIFMSFFLPVIFDQIAQFIAFLPSVANDVINLVNDMFEKLTGYGFDISSTRDTMINYINNFSESLSSSLPEFAVNFAGTLFSGVLDFVLSLILGIYILIDFDDIKAKMYSIIPKSRRVGTIKLIESMGIETRKTVNGILLIASMVFVCDTIGFAIIGLEAALLLGLFCGVTDLIPYIGPYIGGGFAVLIGFAQGPVVGIGVLIVALLVQAIENYVLQPVVMSKATNIHPIIIMTSLLIFGYFFGIIGMILSTPILSVIKVILTHFNKKHHFYGDATLKQG